MSDIPSTVYVAYGFRGGEGRGGGEETEGCDSDCMSIAWTSNPPQQQEQTGQKVEKADWAGAHARVARTRKPAAPPKGESSESDNSYGDSGVERNGDEGESPLKPSDDSTRQDVEHCTLDEGDDTIHADEEAPPVTPVTQADQQTDVSVCICGESRGGAWVCECVGLLTGSMCACACVMSGNG